MRNQEATIKRRSIFLAGLLLLMMLLTGTWAWQSFNQRAFNPAYGRSNYGGRLHDDYDGYNIGTHNKDVYAENFGENDLFIRVQLREFFAIGGTPVGVNPSAISINDPSTWSIYHSNEDDVTTRRAGTGAALIGAEGIEWAFGGSKIFMPTFNQAAFEAVSIDNSVDAPFNHLTAYQMTNTTGTAVDAIANGFNISDMTSVEDILKHGFQTGLGDGSHDYWTEGATASEPVLRVDESGRLYQTAEETHTAKSTLLPEHGGIMTMREWREKDEPNGNFWVLDTDGWFYWASPLPAGEATSLLLDEITIREQRQDWEYVVTAVADIATVTDIENMPDLSDDAKDLWNKDEFTIPTEQGETFEDPDTGTEWRVLVPDDGNGNALIITEYVHMQNMPYHSTFGFTLFQSSVAQTNVRNWFNNPQIVGSTLKAIALDYEFQDADGNSIARTSVAAGSGIEVNRGNGTINTGTNRVPTDTNVLRGLTRPLAQGTGTPEPFVLSVSEANRYFTSNANRQTQLATDTSSNALWWLRSPGSSSGTGSITFEQSRHGMVQAAGSIGFGSAIVANPNRGIRPALWVRR